MSTVSAYDVRKGRRKRGGGVTKHVEQMRRRLLCWEKWLLSFGAAGSDGVSGLLALKKISIDIGQRKRDAWRYDGVLGY